MLLRCYPLLAACKTFTVLSVDPIGCWIYDRC